MLGIDDEWDIQYLRSHDGEKAAQDEERKQKIKEQILKSFKFIDGFSAKKFYCELSEDDKMRKK